MDYSYDRAASKKPGGEQFAELLKKKSRNVSYKNDEGTADLGRIQIKWSQSTNGEGIHLEGSFDSVKTTPADAIKVLEEMSAALRKL